MKKIFLGFVLVFCLMIPFVHADTIQLVTGEIIEGEITRRTPAFVRINLYEGSVKKEYLMENIASISADGNVQQVNALINSVENMFDENAIEKEDEEKVVITNASVESVFSEDKKKKEAELLKKYFPEIEYDEKTGVITQSNGSSQNLNTFTAPPQVSQVFKPRINFSGEHSIGVMIAFFVFIFAVYFLSCYPFYFLAKKTNVEYAAFAWVPILQILLICWIARKPWWWALLFIIPLVNIIVSILLWCAISEEAGKSSWLGLLVLIPIVNVVFLWYLALSCEDRSGVAPKVGDTKNQPQEKKPEAPKIVEKPRGKKDNKKDDKKGKEEKIDPNEALKRQIYGDSEPGGGKLKRF